jgi:hypothetical protein
MIKRMIMFFVLVGAVLAGVFGFKIFDDGQVKAFMASKGNLPQTVSTTKAARSDWQPKLQAVGSLRASNGADLSLQLGGIVEETSLPVRRQGGEGPAAAPPAQRRRHRQAEGPGGAAGTRAGSGIALGTLFTLFVVPAVYVLLAADDSKKGVTEEAGPISPAE